MAALSAGSVRRFTSDACLRGRTGESTRESERARESAHTREIERVIVPDRGLETSEEKRTSVHESKISVSHKLYLNEPKSSFVEETSHETLILTT